MADPVICDVADGIATLTLSNPPLNIVFRGMTQALDHALEAIEQDSAIRAVVVTGAGTRAFCAGSDIAEFQPWMQPGRIVPEKLALQHRVFARLDTLAKPTVAAINGLAFGGGLEIAACCDLIVADQAARFALPEIKLGVFPGSGGPVRVTRRIGEARAKEMMFLGEPIDAQTALAWGLINRVVARDTALPAALALAATLAKRPPLALALCKRAIDLSFDATQEEAIAAALPLSERVFTSVEAQEGVRAFLAKEVPHFPNALYSERQD